MVVSGSTGHPGVGEVYVYTKTATGWHRTAVLVDPDAVEFDGFPTGLAISGSTIVAGSGQTVYLFHKSAAAGWRQTAALTTEVGLDGASAISGNTLVVGAYSAASFAGRVFVFTKTATGWNEHELGSSSFPHDEFGISVALSGSSLVVRSMEGGSYAGRVFVFQG